MVKKRKYKEEDVVHGITFLREEGRMGSENRMHWRFKCHCGEEFVALAKNIYSGNTKSCGCAQLKHGDSYSRLYYIWKDIKKRCLNINFKHYPYYGGRGITVCDEWLDYVTFKEWAESSGYNEQLTIDRKDVNGNYEPDNCRWVKWETQMRNRRVQPDSRSGFTGVNWGTKEQKWVTRLYVNKKTERMGTFSSLREAVEARQQAELKYWGFTNITEEDLNEIKEENYV